VPNWGERIGYWCRFDGIQHPILKPWASAIGLILNLFAGALHIFTSAVSGPASGRARDQSKGSKGQQQQFLYHNFLSLVQVYTCGLRFQSFH
jgi:hypothetical protein